MKSLLVQTSVAAANIEGRPFGVKVQKSGIQGAGLGIWATRTTFMLRTG